VPEAEPDAVEAHVQLALRMRPDLNQARVSLQRGDLDVVKTKNGLLPQMDLFITLGKSGYADSFGDSVADLTGDSYDALLGVDLEYPLDNRAARARYGRAVRGRDQADEAVQNLAQLVELDVRSAYIEVSRAREQVAATAATRTLQEETLRAETEKFRVGKSTTFLVARAQRDLLASQIGEIEAVVNYRTALVELYRLEGSLLARRGITTPGDRAEQSKNPAR
jgi:outer membrane protein TolC